MLLVPALKQDVCVLQCPVNVITDQRLYTYVNIINNNIIEGKLSK